MTAKDMVKIALNLVVIYAVGGLLLAGVYAKTSPIIFKKNKEEKEAALSKMMPFHLKIKVPGSAVEDIEKLLPAASGPPAILNAEEGFKALDVELDIYEKALKKLKKKLKKAGAVDIEEYSLNKPEKVDDWDIHHKHAEYYEVKDDDGLVGYIAETYGKGYSSYINIYVAVSKDFVVRKISVLHHAETPGLGDEIETAWFKDQYKSKGIEHLEVIKGPTEDKIQAITGATISTRAVTNGVKDALAMLKEKYRPTGRNNSEEKHSGEVM